MKIVQKLCEPFEGTYRSIYVDRFYTSIDLIQTLEKMKLYVTGTVMANRLPKQVQLTANEVRSMERGEYLHHLYNYKNESGEVKGIGLVQWKDSKMVYCLTNHHPTFGVGTCYRKTMSGNIRLDRPNVIEEYNSNMGGVDLADMRRLHSTTSLMGQNRWWLKLFFYLVDVATANSLILYRLAVVGTPNENMNIVDFKRKLLHSILGQKIQDICPPVQANHELERCEQRHLCVFCLLSGRQKRTRYKCRHPDCRLPLCSVGTGRSNEDCFALAHATTEVLAMNKRRHELSISKTNKKFK